MADHEKDKKYTDGIPNPNVLTGPPEGKEIPAMSSMVDEAVGDFMDNIEHAFDDEDRSNEKKDQNQKK